MKKAIIVLMIGVLIISIMFLLKNILTTITIEKNLYLSGEDKKELDYGKLIKDIKALENYEELKYAKYVRNEDNSNMGKIMISLMDSKYQGDGYYIVEEGGVSDACIYNIYTNKDKKIYECTKSAWGHDIIREKNVFYILIAIVAIIDFCISIIIYIKNKKAIKNQNGRSL